MQTMVPVNSVVNLFGPVVPDFAGQANHVSTNPLCGGNRRIVFANRFDLYGLFIDRVIDLIEI